MDDAGTEALPEGVHHYTSADEVPSDILKYWQQRHEIFSKYDEGVWMTDSAWFGVTPEPIASKIASHIATSVDASKTVLIDAFGGAGGNAIAFALTRRWTQIFAVERDPQVLACAKHNAQVYGVEKSIWWIAGDVFDVLRARLKAAAKKAVIFASPPWGGPTYTDWDVFDLAAMEPYSLGHLQTSFTALSSHVVLFLPRSSDLRQIARSAPREGDGTTKLQVVHYCMYGASKALCVFYGDWAAISAVQA